MRTGTSRSRSCFGLHVTVAEDGPQLHVWASILAELGDRTAAAQNLPELSAEWPRLRFTIEDGHLLVSTLVDADPFAPQHLINLVDEIHEFTHDLDDAFAAKFGGVPGCHADDNSYARGCGDDCASGDGHEAGPPRGYDPGRPPEQLTHHGAR